MKWLSQASQWQRLERCSDVLINHSPQALWEEKSCPVFADLKPHCWQIWILQEDSCNVHESRTNGDSYEGKCSLSVQAVDFAVCFSSSLHGTPGRLLGRHFVYTAADQELAGCSQIHCSLAYVKSGTVCSLSLYRDIVMQSTIILQTMDPIQQGAKYQLEGTEHPQVPMKSFGAEGVQHLGGLDSATARIAYRSSIACFCLLSAPGKWLL